jgi:outer membrane cobalamin receptor
MSWFTGTPWVSTVLLSFALVPVYLHAAVAENKVPTATATDYRLPPISVTATRLNREVPNLGIDAEQINVSQAQKQGHLDINSVLRSHPLLSTNSEAGVGGIFITGLPSQQVRILIDGIDIKDAISTQGAPYVDTVILDTFNSVDIVSTGMGTLYGSDAVGGVIVFKSDPKARFFKHFFRTNYTRTTTQWQEDTEIGSLTIQHASLRDSTFSAYAEGKETDPKHVENWGIIHQIDLKPFSFETTYKRLDGSFGLDENATTSEDNKILYAQQDLFGSTAKFTLNEHHNVALRYTSHRLTRRDNFYDYWIAFSGKSESIQLTHTGYYDNTTVISGYERYMEDGQDSWNPNKHFHRDSLFSRGLISLPQFTLGLGYRQEWFEASSIGTYDLSLGTQIDKFTFKSSISTGYRFPSIGEWSANQFSGDPIGPESSLTSRIEGSYPYGPVEIGVMYFDNHINNKIDYNFDTYAYFNQSEKFISHGFQYRLSLLPVAIIDSLDLIYVEQQAHQGNDQALRVPNTKAIIRGSLKYGKWEIGGSLTAVGNRVDKVSNPGPTVPLDAYTDLTASIRYSLTETATVSLTGTNLLGQKIELVKNFHTVASSITAGIDIQL